MPQKLPVNNFEWIKDTALFNEDFIKTMMKKVMNDIFLKWMFNIFRTYINFMRPCQIDFLFGVTLAHAEKLGALNLFIHKLARRFILIIIGEKDTTFYTFQF